MCLKGTRAFHTSRQQDPSNSVLTRLLPSDRAAHYNAPAKPEVRYVAWLQFALCVWPTHLEIQRMVSGISIECWSAVSRDGILFGGVATAGQQHVSESGGRCREASA